MLALEVLSNAELLGRYLTCGTLMRVAMTCTALRDAVLRHLRARLLERVLVKPFDVDGERCPYGCESVVLRYAGGVRQCVHCLYHFRLRTVPILPLDDADVAAWLATARATIGARHASFAF